MMYRLFSTSLVSRTVGILIMAGMLAFCQSDATSKKTADTGLKQAEKIPEKNSQRERKLIVYYFHTNFRCHSCITIEKLTRQAVTSGFASQLNSGRIEFKEVNVEDAGNEHFTDDYKLYTKSVILSDVKNGQEASWKNLDKVWKLLRDEQKFIDYIQTEVNTLL